MVQVEVECKKDGRFPCHSKKLLHYLLSSIFQYYGKWQWLIQSVTFLFDSDSDSISVQKGKDLFLWILTLIWLVAIKYWEILDVLYILNLVLLKKLFVPMSFPSPTHLPFFSVPSLDLPKPTFHWLHCSTLGQGLQTSTYPGEVIFSIALAIFGLILFALLIGNMQVYFKSLSLTYHESKISGSLIIQFVQNLQEFPWACIWLGQIYWIYSWIITQC